MPCADPLFMDKHNKASGPLGQHTVVASYCAWGVDIWPLHLVHSRLEFDSKNHDLGKVRFAGLPARCAAVGFWQAYLCMAVLNNVQCEPHQWTTGYRKWSGHSAQWLYGDYTSNWQVWLLCVPNPLSTRRASLHIYVPRREIHSIKPLIAVPRQFVPPNRTG